MLLRAMHIIMMAIQCAFKPLATITYSYPWQCQASDIDHIDFEPHHSQLFNVAQRWQDRESLLGTRLTPYITSSFAQDVYAQSLNSFQCLQKSGFEINGLNCSSSSLFILCSYPSFTPYLDLTQYCKYRGTSLVSYEIPRIPDDQAASMVKMNSLLLLPSLPYNQISQAAFHTIPHK